MSGNEKLWACAAYPLESDPRAPIQPRSQKRGKSGTDGAITNPTLVI